MHWMLALLACAAILAVAEAADPAQPEIKTIAKGAFSGIQKAAQIVVTNQTQWAELWREHTIGKEPRPAAPEIDFAKETVIFAALGRKTSGGHSIEVTALRPAAGKTEIILRIRQPKPGGMNLQALTAPYHLARVPKITNEFAFKIE